MNTRATQVGTAMNVKMTLFLIASVWTSSSQAGFYKCEDQDGVEFSDTPCGEIREQLQTHGVTQQEQKKEPNTKKSQRVAGTNLARIKVGMSRSEVEYLVNNPPEFRYSIAQSRYPNLIEEEWFIAVAREQAFIVNFQNGIVTSMRDHPE